MNKLLAASDDIFGTINPPVSGIPKDPEVALGKTISFGVQLFILVAAITMLLYLMLGAFDWIVSGGEKEKISKAQNKITNAVVGMLIVIVALVIFGYITGDILGIIKHADSGWSFELPSLNGN